MSLREDFRDIGYEMARMVTKEVEMIQKKALSAIDFIKEETKKKLEKDLIKLEAELINRSLQKLNINETERVAEINQAIANKKNECIENFIIFFKEQTQLRIKKNSQKYSMFIMSKIMEFLPLIDRPVKVQFNTRDLQYIKENTFFNPIPEKQNLLRLDERPLDVACGFKIVSEDKAFTIDYTLESLIEKYKQELSLRFMKIFPIFEIKVKNAMEIDMQQHGGAKRHER
ncbi:V-type proton ATPase subunit E [Candidatus Lokiarchaeum ossiferum]|uniref:V-type proton ATPase subunit E n=1 Tax=Candidatus Lokiarchaeum ossiferum TaxID=2951803 RepID=A0ABY6HZ61_9ARCH|nr:V-type proton ATPase subunit E [Candidatus Lokiarchaeum sp. B-35]